MRCPHSSRCRDSRRAAAVFAPGGAADLPLCPAAQAARRQDDRDRPRPQRRQRRPARHDQQAGPGRRLHEGVRHDRHRDRRRRADRARTSTGISRERLRKLLERDGAKVVLTRKNDRGVGPCINRRARRSATAPRPTSRSRCTPTAARAGRPRLPRDPPRHRSRATPSRSSSRRALARDVARSRWSMPGLSTSTYAGRNGTASPHRHRRDQPLEGAQGARRARQHAQRRRRPPHEEPKLAPVHGPGAARRADGNLTR